MGFGRANRLEAVQAASGSLPRNSASAYNWRELHAKVMNATTAHLLKYMRAYPCQLTGAIGARRINNETGEQTHLSAEDLDEPSAVQWMQKLDRPGETVAHQHYAAGSGGYHHWHSEIYPQSANCETLHRVLLFMFYINTVAEGGETEFLYQDKKINPQAGRMVIAPAGFTHTHKGPPDFMGSLQPR